MYSKLVVGLVYVAASASIWSLVQECSAAFDRMPQVGMLKMPESTLSTKEPVAQPESIEDQFQNTDPLGACTRLYPIMGLENPNVLVFNTIDEGYQKAGYLGAMQTITQFYAVNVVGNKGLGTIDLRTIFAEQLAYMEAQAAVAKGIDEPLFLMFWPKLGILLEQQKVDLMQIEHNVLASIYQWSVMSAINHACALNKVFFDCFQRHGPNPPNVDQAIEKFWQCTQPHVPYLDKSDLGDLYLAMNNGVQPSRLHLVIASWFQQHIFLASQGIVDRETRRLDDMLDITPQ